MHEEYNVHANFHCWVSVTLIFCYKITHIAYMSLQMSRFFSLTRMYVHVRWNVREASSLTRKCTANIVLKYERSLAVG